MAPIVPFRSADRGSSAATLALDAMRANACFQRASGVRHLPLSPLTNSNRRLEPPLATLTTTIPAPTAVDASTAITPVTRERVASSNVTGALPARRVGKYLPCGSILFTAEELLKAWQPSTQQPDNEPAALPTVSDLAPASSSATTSVSDAPTPATSLASAPPTSSSPVITPPPTPAVLTPAIPVATAAAATSIAPAPATSAAPLTSTPSTSTAAAAPALPTTSASASASSSTPAAPAPPAIDWAARRRKRIVEEIMEAADRLNRRGTVRKGYRPIQTRAVADPEQQKFDAKAIEAGLQQLETLLPGFQPNLDGLPAATWAKLALDIDGVAMRLVALKAAWPGTDLSALLTLNPRALTTPPDVIAKDGAKVRELLKTSKNPDAIIQAIPVMLTAQVAASILVTVNKWYGFKRDPVEVLEKDPELVLRAQLMEQPFEPVYEDEDGNWVVPGAIKASKPAWAQAIADQAARQGQERQDTLKKQHKAMASSREGAGTTSFVSKTFESLD